MDYAPDGTNLLQMTLIGHFRLVQHHQDLLARLLGKGDQVRFSSINFSYSQIHLQYRRNEALTKFP